MGAVVLGSGAGVEGDSEMIGDEDSVGEALIEVSAHDAAGAALTGLKVHGLLAAPADVKRDRPVELAEAAPGVYRGEAMAQAGAWDLELTAARDGKTLFQSHNRINLR